MNEEQARDVAEALGGTMWQSGGNIWLVLFEKADGEIVALSDEVVCEYVNQEALENSKPSASILLS